MANAMQRMIPGWSSETIKLKYIHYWQKMVIHSIAKEITSTATLTSKAC